MDKFPSVDMEVEQEAHELDIKEDLEVIASEDLKSDPFIRAAPIKPPQPPVKKKRAVSDKQRTHLANMRKMAKEKRDSKKLEPPKVVEAIPPQAVEPQSVEPQSVEAISPQSEVDTQIDGFDQFLGYMDRFQDIRLTQQKELAEKKAAEDSKEKAMEEKYFKKFREQHPNSFKPIKKSTKKISTTNLDILNQKTGTNDFGMYSGYF